MYQCHSLLYIPCSGGEFQPHNTTLFLCGPLASSSLRFGSCLTMHISLSLLCPLSLFFVSLSLLFCVSFVSPIPPLFPSLPFPPLLPPSLSQLKGVPDGDFRSRLRTAAQKKIDTRAAFPQARAKGEQVDFRDVLKNRVSVEKKAYSSGRAAQTDFREQLKKRTVGATLLSLPTTLTIHQSIFSNPCLWLCLAKTWCPLFHGEESLFQRVLFREIIIFFLRC